jgi:hypothetical protein
MRHHHRTSIRAAALALSLAGGLALGTAPARAAGLAAEEASVRDGLEPRAAEVIDFPLNARLEGTWVVTATLTNPPGIPPLEVLLTFMPGRTESEGTLVDTNSAQLTPNPVCTPDQGVWKRVKRREFVTTHKNYCFDATSGFAFAGPTLIYDSLTLANDGNSLTGTQHIVGYDAQGNVVFVGDATLAGSRLQAQAPPG